LGRDLGKKRQKETKEGRFCCRRIKGRVREWEKDKNDY